MGRALSRSFLAGFVRFRTREKRRAGRWVPGLAAEAET